MFSAPLLCLLPSLGPDVFVRIVMWAMCHRNECLPISAPGCLRDFSVLSQALMIMCTAPDGVCVVPSHVQACCGMGV